MSLCLNKNYIILLIHNQNNRRQLQIKKEAIIYLPEFRVTFRRVFLRPIFKLGTATTTSTTIIQLQQIYASMPIQPFLQWKLKCRTVDAQMPKCFLGLRKPAKSNSPEKQLCFAC